MRIGWLLCGAVAVLAARPAAALVEVDLADIEGTQIRATLDEDDNGFVNPGDSSPFTQWVESGITVEPAPGDLGFLSGGNADGLLFSTPISFGFGTAVVTLDAPQSYAAIEVGFMQPYIRVAIFSDAGGTQEITNAVLGEREFPVQFLPVFVFFSDVPFQRMTIQHTNALGEIQNSNQISDLRFAKVPEPSRLVALAFAAAALTWLRRR